ncbi:hypothetical protein ACWDOP_34030 [Nocardia sp. NPDC003693]
MGDFFERIVDLEVSAGEAEAAGASVIEWMVSRGWLTRETSGETMYSRHAEEGFVAGPGWAEIAGNWGADWIPGPVAVITGRHAHYGGQGEIEPAAALCPRCDARTVIIDYPQRWEADPAVWQPFSEAIEAWEHTGEGAAACPACGASSPITEWRWADEMALATLAFDFWGWPPLTDAFVAECAARLGRPVARQSGKF